jgi:ACS family glucarate transporter-like MFS transporter
MRSRTNVRWLLIGWTFAISAVAYLDRVNISIAGHSIALEYHFSNVELGYVFSAFVLGYALFQAPGGRLADWLGPRLTLTAGLMWWGVFSALSAAIPSAIGRALWILVAVRFTLGIGEAVMYPASNRLVAEWIPSSERGRANGVIFAGVGAGAGVTPPQIVYVMQHYGWRWSFFVSAGIGVAAAVIWYLIARDTPAEHPLVNEEERRFIEAGLPQLPTTTTREVPWRAIGASRELWAMTLSYFAYGYAAYIFFSWFFIYLNSVRGLDLKASRWYGMLPFIAMAICSPLGGWISDAISRRSGERAGRCGIAVFGMAFAAVFIAAATQVQSARLASMILAGGAGALYLSQSSFWAVTADIAGSCAGTVSGLMNMGGQIGGAVTASLTPWIATRYGWTASFVTAGSLCALGAVAWLVVEPLRKLAESRDEIRSTAARH